MASLGWKGLSTKSVRYHIIILAETERPLNVSVSLSMAFAAEAHRVEGNV
jgi:hypothetical protein